MNLKKIMIGALVPFLLTACTNSNDGPKTEVVLEYPGIVLKAENANSENVYPTTVKGQEDIEIRPRIDGFIKQIFVDEGSVVRKGQTLFTIDSPSSIQAVASAEAAINNAESVLNTAILNVERMTPLAQEGIISKFQLDTYQNARISAQASVDQAKASLRSAKESLSWTNVSSPVDGIVGKIPFRLGSLVNSSNQLTTVANTSNVYAYFSLNERSLMAFLGDLEGKTQAEKIKNIPPVTLTLSDGTVYAEKGKIETISGSIDITTGTANFRAEFPNPSGVLRSGLSGKLSIPKVIHSSFVIPQKSTFAQQDKILVYKVVGDSTVQTIISVEMMPDGKNYAVTGGLSEGETIVSDNIATVKNGMKVKIKQANL